MGATCNKYGEYRCESIVYGSLTIRDLVLCHQDSSFKS